MLADDPVTDVTPRRSEPRRLRSAQLLENVFQETAHEDRVQDFQNLHISHAACLVRAPLARTCACALACAYVCACVRARLWACVRVCVCAHATAGMLCAVLLFRLPSLPHSLPQSLTHSLATHTHSLPHSLTRARAHTHTHNSATAKCVWKGMSSKNIGVKE